MVNPVNTGAGGAYAAQLGRKTGPDEAGKSGDAKGAKSIPADVAKLVNSDLGADGAAEAAKLAGQQVGEQSQALVNADPRSLMKLFDV